MGGILASTLGCAVVRSLAAVHNHPLPLAGVWVDRAATTPTDTVLWLLTAAGEDASRHVLVVHDAAADANPRWRTTLGPTRYYGLWFVQGALADTSGRKLCFIPRPGRSRSYCQTFELDSMVAGTRTTRRLILRGEQGRHRFSNHVLYSRTP